MKLAFDYQIFLAQKNGGISRYFCNLIKHLKNNPELEISLPIHHHDNEYLQDVKEIIDFKPCKKSRSFNPFKKSPDQNLLVTKKFLEAQDFDLLHATYYDDYFLESLGNKPLVITIHDMIYELFPEFFSLKDRTTLIKKELALRADKIIVISEQTKKDLLKFVDVKEEKIAVIYQACSLDENVIKNSHFKKLEGTKNYLLFVGNRTIYKNFYFMLASIAETLKKNPDLDLVCFGAPLNKKERSFISNLGLEKKVKIVSGCDNDLIGLYKNALAFISPSYYEGFGVTILEAFACGCPVLAANTSVTPEAAGNAALYFDPKDNISIKNAVEEIISNSNLRAELIKKGYERNKLFAWPQISQQMLQAYKTIL